MLDRGELNKLSTRKDGVAYRARQGLTRQRLTRALWAPMSLARVVSSQLRLVDVWGRENVGLGETVAQISFAFPLVFGFGPELFGSFSLLFVP